MDILQKVKNIAGNEEVYDIFSSLHKELQEALSLYCDIAAQTLNKSGLNIRPFQPEYFSIEKNFFSALFLYSYFRAGIPKSRRILYAAVNQCLRGMVTGCDNILDDEYKKTIESDLPEQATRFRSILDIMISDRVLFAILFKAYLAGELSSEQMLKASFESLRTLAKSGAQEASEEGGANKIIDDKILSEKILSPENILEKVHHYKTGVLFQSPWALPEIIENQDLKDKLCIKNALFQIGMGCQILDDMVDIGMDILMNRHNYLVSLIWHGNKIEESAILESIFRGDRRVEKNQDVLNQFPKALERAAETALKFLRTGTKALFAEKHNFIVDISISFIVRRIGAERFLPDFKC